LVRAFALLRQRVKRVKLLKVGAAHFSQERKRLLSLIAELGIQDDVLFLDEVPEDDLPLFYSAADMLAMPSLYEGFGLPVLEAMSCGTPVVCSNRASLPEVVGKGGLLVDPEDVQALAQRSADLLVDLDQHTVAAQAALRQSERFSVKHQANEMVKVYIEAVKADPQRRAAKHPPGRVMGKLPR
jgi:glycosyltransferase involved in cell wall biosynthesis